MKQYCFDISQAKKYSYSGIVIPTLLKVNQLRDGENIDTFNSKKIVIPQLVFHSVFLLGKQINDLQDEEKVLDSSKEWIESNYFPFPPDKFYNDISNKIFAEKIKYVYLIYSAALLLQKIRKNKLVSSDHISKLKYYYDALGMNDIIMTYINKITTDELESDAYSTNDFLKLTNDINITEDTKDFFVNVSLNILIYYVFDITKNQDYMVSALMPIEFSNKFYLYKYSNSLMGVVYYELLNNIVSNNNTLNISECIYCKEMFAKSNNHQDYCEKCIALGIPKKVRDKRFHESKKGKEYHQKYYKEYYKEKKEKSTQ